MTRPSFPRFFSVERLRSLIDEGLSVLHICEVFRADEAFIRSVMEAEGLRTRGRLDPVVRRRILARVEAGERWSDLGRAYGLHPDSVYHLARKHGSSRVPPLPAHIEARS